MKLTEPQADTSWHMAESRAVLASLAVQPEVGLTEAEVERRRQQHGPNELVERGLKSPWRILWEQVTAVLVLVLIGAAVVKLLLGEYLDAIAILAVVLLNAILGFFQEYRAERAMAALKRLAAPLVRVRRDGRLRELPSRDLLPGDIILLEAGNTIPADARLVESANLRVQEASLTGESLPVDKVTEALPAENLPLGDRQNMLYLGTAVTYGRGAAVVVGTGMGTELGRIAALLQGVATDQTPLQKRIKQLSLFLALAVLAIVRVVCLVGVLRGQDGVRMFLAGVAIAVAAIPEGLPAVLTITLALGAQRLLQRRALIRKLPAVETLGSVTVICSDKTGTLTENRMTVQTLDVAGHTADLSEVMRTGHPMLAADDRPETLKEPAQALLLTASALCDDALLQRDDTNPQEFYTVGDPTEGALVVAAAHFQLWKPELEQTLVRIGEVPFSSERKRMTTGHRLERAPGDDGAWPLASVLERGPFERVAFTKGAVDGLSGERRARRRGHGHRGANSPEDRRPRRSRGRRRERPADRLGRPAEFREEQ